MCKKSNYKYLPYINTFVLYISGYLHRILHSYMVFWHEKAEKTVPTTVIVLDISRTAALRGVSMQKTCLTSGYICVIFSLLLWQSTTLNMQSIKIRQNFACIYPCLEIKIIFKCCLWIGEAQMICDSRGFLFKICNVLAIKMSWNDRNA